MLQNLKQPEEQTAMSEIILRNYSASMQINTLAHM